MLSRSPLVCFGFWLPKPAAQAPLLALLPEAIVAHLGDRGWPAMEPLRWAITAVDPVQGWWLEGVAVATPPGLPEPP